MLARYGKDNMWYRARVLKEIDTEPLTGQAAKSMYEILYVDYGNTETIPFSRYDRLIIVFVLFL